MWPPMLKLSTTLSDSVLDQKSGMKQIEETTFYLVSQDHPLRDPPSRRRDDDATMTLDVWCDHICCSQQLRMSQIDRLTQGFFLEGFEPLDHRFGKELITQAILYETWNFAYFLASLARFQNIHQASIFIIPSDEYHAGLQKWNFWTVEE